MIKKFLIVTVGLILLSGCNLFSSKPSYDLGYEVADFQFTNQDGKSFGLSDLKGQVWITDFIFTSCETVCPPMTANMAKIQRMLKEEGVDARIVSFSVDPEVDSPEKLKEFAKKFEADFSNWTFLTGYTQDEIEEFAKNNFKALVDKPDNQAQVTHATSFYLVDQEGVVVTSYSGVSDTPYEKIVEDIKMLVK